MTTDQLRDLVFATLQSAEDNGFTAYAHDVPAKNVAADIAVNAEEHDTVDIIPLIIEWRGQRQQTVWDALPPLGAAIWEGN